MVGHSPVRDMPKHLDLCCIHMVQANSHMDLDWFASSEDRNLGRMAVLSVLDQDFRKT